jgi:flavin reductase (DIM6/NTAB) family NADH-FMN oxidoreductase RutF
MVNQDESIQLFKEIMGSYPTGVTVVTTTDSENQPVGLTVNSFASVSLDPLLVLWSIDKNSGSYEVFKQTNRFAINILAGDQKEVCWSFAGRSEADRFEKNSWQMSDNQLPILKNTFAVFECEKFQAIDAGDHDILIGKVIALQKSEKDPMLYYQRNVGYTVPPSAVAK